MHYIYHFAQTLNTFILKIIIRKNGMKSGFQYVQKEKKIIPELQHFFHAVLRA